MDFKGTVAWCALLFTSSKKKRVLGASNNKSKINERILLPVWRIKDISKKVFLDILECVMQHLINC
jgi:hypothetical protein